MKVQDPSGQVWRVTRRWLPWRRKAWSRDDIEIPDPSNGGLDVDDLVIGLVLMIVVVVLAVFAPWLILGVFVGFELLALIVLLPLALVARFVFGKAWHVEVRRGWKGWHEQEAGDWQASTLRIHALARAIETGEIPPRNLTGVRWRREKDEAG